MSSVYVVRVGERVVAVVSREKVLLEPLEASALEPCLSAYGMTVLLGEEDSYAGFTGWIARAGKLSPAQAAKAIQVCIAFTSSVEASIDEEPDPEGERAAAEQEARVKGGGRVFYELKPPSQESGEEYGLEFEQA